MPDKQQLHNLIDQLPESEIPPAARFLEFLLAREAPVDADLLAFCAPAQRGLIVRVTNHLLEFPTLTY